MYVQTCFILLLFPEKQRTQLYCRSPLAATKLTSCTRIRRQQQGPDPQYMCSLTGSKNIALKMSGVPFEALLQQAAPRPTLVNHREPFLTGSQFEAVILQQLCRARRQAAQSGSIFLAPISHQSISWSLSQSCI